jgi:methionyl-tRNA formyltransferase
MLDLVFMGTAEFATASLQVVVAAGHRVLAVVTQPDRPRGRGMQPHPSPVKALAESLGLPVLQPEKASNEAFVEDLRNLAPQAIVVVAYGQILRPAVLEIPPLGCLNVHGSLLPQLRGAAPIQRAVLEGLPETGVTTMYMDRGMDTGDMILRATTPIQPHDTAGSLAERLAPMGAELLRETVTLVEAGQAPRALQDPALATYAAMLHREDGAVAWDKSAVEIRNRIHGCNPSPGAYATRNGRPVKLWRAELASELDEAAASTAPGTILDAKEPVLATGLGALRLLELQPESRARVSGHNYCVGQRVTMGERWGNGETSKPS